MIGDIFAGKIHKTQCSDLYKTKQTQSRRFPGPFIQDVVEKTVVCRRFLILFVWCNFLSINCWLFFFFFLNKFVLVLWSIAVEEDSKTFHPLVFMRELCGGKTTRIQNANMPFNICRAKRRPFPTVAAALNRSLQ